MKQCTYDICSNAHTLQRTKNISDFWGGKRSKYLPENICQKSKLKFSSDSKVKERGLTPSPLNFS